MTPYVKPCKRCRAMLTYADYEPFDVFCHVCRAVIGPRKPSRKVAIPKEYRTLRRPTPEPSGRRARLKEEPMRAVA